MIARISIGLVLWGMVTVQAAEIIPPAGPHIMVIGRSRIAVEPNQAVVQLQITLETENVARAKQQIDRQVNGYLAFLQQQGVPKQHIDATRLQSQRLFAADAVVKDQPLRYRLTRQITLTVQPFTKLNHLLQEALRCGLQELQAVRFGVAEERPYRLQARAQAIQDACAQAAEIATQFNSQRGAVYSIRYQPLEALPSFSTRATLFDSAATAQADQSYLPQTLYFTDQVEAIFRLKTE